MSKGKAKILPTELARREREIAEHGRYFDLVEAVDAAVSKLMRRDPQMTIDDVVFALGSMTYQLEHYAVIRDDLRRRAGRSPEEGN
jgi:hypothetical protein